MQNAAAAAQQTRPRGSDAIAPDCHGLNFFEIDRGLRDLLQLYLPADLHAALLPQYRALGEIAGGQLDALARQSDRHGPVLHHRDAVGRDEDWVEFHPAYREMEKIALERFGIHCMSRRAGVFGLDAPVPPPAKYAFQYIFAQSEFGLMCPISATETTALLIERYGDEKLKSQVLSRMLEQDRANILMGAQFMTEKTGGSDVSTIALTARNEDGVWRLYGDKWFCSCADADIALLLARPEGAPEGNAGLGLFALPRRLADGSRNRYRVVRLKDKLGSRSMASGEIIFEGAVAYPLGEVGAQANKGLKQMLDQVNMSRLSHGVRAAAMMRRCFNEALVVANARRAFGSRLIDKPMVRRQLAKLALPTEQALTMSLYAADCLQKADAGDKDAERLTRILTPMLKYRTARDNVTVATGAMEMRGGNGYIEDFVNARLVRDAHLGVIWEGTSNINSIDVIDRAVGRVGAHEDLGRALEETIEAADGVPGQFRGELGKLAGRAIAFADQVARDGAEGKKRQAARALYNATSAVQLAREGAALGRKGGDARRLVLAQMVVDHRLRPQDPLAGSESSPAQIDAILSEEMVSLEAAQALVR